MKQGILYGVGVGPGDPELLTLKAVRILKEADVIAVPASGEGKKTAFSIAAAYIEGKPILECEMPMLRDREKLNRSYDKTAERIAGLLDDGLVVAFITLGDPSIYSTFTYLHRRLDQKGYRTAWVPGVPSFCAAAAALNRPLCEGSEMLHIIPASHGAEEGLSLSGTRVVMKAGKDLNTVVKALHVRGEAERAGLVECCGMQQERIVPSLAGFQGESSYFSLIVVKEIDT